MTDSAPLARWWREPWWARLTLLAILCGSTVLTGWNLARGGDAVFYEAAARSMSESWHALAFGAFDPAASVTLDKLAGFAVPQALSIRLFGMSTSSIALPQLLEGLVTVTACSVLGLRWVGRGLGLVAAAAAASTPIFVSMFGHPMEDGLLTAALAVALVWWQRAVLTERWWPLVLAGVFIGIGFQAKMMQAWFVLPALVVATLGGVRGWRRALAWAGGLLAVAVGASVAWMVAIQAVPAGDRPYIDGSTGNDVFAMVFGFNGVDRLISGAVPGAVVASAHVAAMGGAAGSSPVKLLLAQYATQVGWLYPAALAGLILGAVRWWPRRGRRGGARGAFALLVCLAVWLVTAAGVLSAATVPHTAYVAAIGVQLALLAALGWAEGVRLLASPRVGARLVLPLLLVGQTAWSAALAVGGQLPAVLGLPFAALAGAGLVVVVVAAGRRRRGASERGVGRRGMPSGRRPVALVAAVMILAGPIAFSLQVLDASLDGSGGDALVGLRFPQRAETSAPFAVSPPDAVGGHDSMTADEASLVAAARAAGGGVDGAPLFLTDSWAIAAPIITTTGASVLTDGGYSGQARVFTEQDITRMIAAGRTHLVVLKNSAPPTESVRKAVVADECTQLQEWGPAPTEPGERASAVTGFSLWRCG
ncbi:4-amino-4-deoxy-L-arabinose transferase [Rathayibacter sp. AY1B1]|uniref:ArnT family glycosyltransferase n=1 Tax=unclassified Rathayibacter TaxID=2609250 RepID=UPI000CE8D342|nr:MULTISPECIES: glycosyltransferase family 39 protein [unclassified Rathayibacter]PPI19372.1 4-amino-4-deoxy-L-arabinose transferase [Rathayibacter sp. AY1B6]PPI39171.1 4-amino-4-deoxy-L-arabinose transferase [Rathayibacter sp. AY1B1]